MRTGSSCSHEPDSQKSHSYLPAPQVFPYTARQLCRQGTAQWKSNMRFLSKSQGVGCPKSKTLYAENARPTLLSDVLCYIVL